ncbi:unnamed protein product, partial [marine sediment metagenome]
MRTSTLLWPPIVSPIIALLLLFSGIGPAMAPLPASAQEPELNIIVDPSLANDILEGFPMRKATYTLLTVTNKKPYWVHVKPLTPVGMEVPEPDNTWAKLKVLPPGESAQYRAVFGEPGSGIVFYADVTLESGSEAPIANLWYMLLMLIPSFGSYLTEAPSLVIDLIDITEATSGLMGAVR